VAVGLSSKKLWSFSVEASGSTVGCRKEEMSIIRDPLFTIISSKNAECVTYLGSGIWDIFVSIIHCELLFSLSVIRFRLLVRIPCLLSVSKEKAGFGAG
jgi:hypothetical protein